MPRVQIPVTDIDRDGVAQPAATTSDATNDHYATGAADGRTMLMIVSTDGSPQTVEVVPAPGYTADGLTVNNLSIAVAAGGTVLAGPFRTTTFSQDTSHTLWVNPSVSTNLALRAYRLPTPT